MASDDVKSLAFDLPFAKVLSTPCGDALLIGGKVFHIQGPGGNAANVFASAFRILGGGSRQNTHGAVAGNLGTGGN